MIGSFLAFAPVVPGYARVATMYHKWEWRLPFEALLFSALGLLAICKVVAATYTPFLYFRF